MQIQFLNFLNKVRHKNPLVHNITNYVAAHFTANGLLALGASPIMADEVAEMVEMVSICDALLINIGTLQSSTIEAMLLAGKAANERAIPIVLDPVGVAATSLRRDTVARLLSEVKFTVIRGNASEMAFLVDVAWQGKGVDASKGQADSAHIALSVAKRYGCIAAVSGEIDYISDGLSVWNISNGTPLFPKITASGCLLGAIIAAFLAVAEPFEYTDTVVEACLIYAVAGEMAAEGLWSNQNGMFAVSLIDRLSALTSEQVSQIARVHQEV